MGVENLAVIFSGVLFQNQLGEGEVAAKSHWWSWMVKKSKARESIDILKEDRVVNDLLSHADFIFKTACETSNAVPAVAQCPDAAALLRFMDVPVLVEYARFPQETGQDIVDLCTILAVDANILVDESALIGESLRYCQTTTQVAMVQ